MKSRSYAGFTLIELMIAVSVIAVLVAIAIPSYRTQVIKSHRADAKEALLGAVVAEEKWRAVNTQYTNVISNLKLRGVTSGCTTCYTQNGYYSLDIPVATTTQYTVRATAYGDQNTNDPQCHFLLINQAGHKSATTASSSDTTDICW